MEQQDVFYKKSDYIETANNNKVSRQSVLCGSQNIVLGGKTIIQNECIIRGDLANVRFGRQCIIGAKSVIRPPFKKFTKGVAFFPFNMGDHVMIGEGSVINAASIGSYVNIGKNVVIGRRSVIKECSAIADDSFLPPETVVPPFTMWAGNPAKIVAELPESTQDIMVDVTKSYFEHFIGKP